MGQITVDLDERALEAWRARAQRHGRPLEDEVKMALEREVRPSVEEIFEEMDRIRESVRASHGTLPDSVELIREMREGRE
jgi:plasmid stability protein